MTRRNPQVKILDMAQVQIKSRFLVRGHRTHLNPSPLVLNEDMGKKWKPGTIKRSPWDTQASNWESQEAVEAPCDPPTTSHTEREREGRRIPIQPQILSRLKGRACDRVTRSTAHALAIVPKLYIYIYSFLQTKAIIWIGFEHTFKNYKINGLIGPILIKISVQSYENVQINF